MYVKLSMVNFKDVFIMVKYFLNGKYNFTSIMIDEYKTKAFVDENNVVYFLKNPERCELKYENSSDDIFKRMSPEEFNNRLPEFLNKLLTGVKVQEDFKSIKFNENPASREDLTINSSIWFSLIGIGKSDIWTQNSLFGESDDFNSSLLCKPLRQTSDIKMEQPMLEGLFD